MKSAEIFASIIGLLSDAQIHTTNEIAQYCEVSRKTVCKYLQFLSLEFDIQSFKGGINHGGIRLVSKKITNICNCERENNKGGKNLIDISNLSEEDKLIICELLENRIINNKHINDFTKSIRQTISEDLENGK